MKARGRQKRLRAEAAPAATAGPAPAPPTDAPAGHAQAQRRLKHLYEIGKLFASFEDVDQTLAPVLAIVTRTLPLRSVVLIEQEDGHLRMTVWPTEGESVAELVEAREHAGRAFSYLVGAAPHAPGAFSLRPGSTGLPRSGQPATPPKRFIVIPLVVARRPPFGALQVEAARALDTTDLYFVNAIANQLAVALDRDRAWRRDITRRQHAEQGWTQAEARGVASERGRMRAESASERHAELATENAQLYARAQQAVRAREQLLGIVSHDLKNPLATILATLDALMMRGDTADLRARASASVERVHRAAARMLRIIDDLLDFASIEAGRLRVARQPHAPGPIIHETLAGFEGVAREKQLRLTAELAPGLPELSCDRDRILQVLTNLVGNATKIVPTGGRVTVRVVPHGSELLFAVSDDGPGLGAEDLAHLFERYWRSGEAQYKGTGLGLAIAQGILRAHGGRIWAESELGRGATFFFTLPVVAATAP